MVRIPQRDVPPACESPIESALLGGLMNAARRRGLALAVDTPSGPGILVRRQVPLCGRRADFVVEHGDRRAVVECDGHDFHERTKEQAARDRAFDRAVQREGYVVLRFTGSEIHRGAEACAVEVLAHLLAA